MEIGFWSWQLFGTWSVEVHPIAPLKVRGSELIIAGIDFVDTRLHA